MESETVAPATPTEAAPVETTPEPSIADHEATYGKGAKEAVVAGMDVAEGADKTVERPRHRAKSQQASAADVPRIAELTKKLRDAERERDEWKTKVSSAPAPQQPPPPSSPAPAAPVSVNGSDKPTWKAFEAKIGTEYETWGDATDAYNEARDDWKDAQIKKQSEEQRAVQSQQAVYDRYKTRAQEYGKQPGSAFHQKMDANSAMFNGMPMPLLEAIVRLDNGPFIAEYLVDHPDVLDDLWIQTEGKPVTESFVALLQRRLSHFHAPAAATRSVATSPPRIAARPPNPVRTGPLNTGDDLPGDDASIAEHERVFGKKRRR